MLISSGFAGSLTDQLGVGDVILAENFSDPAAINRVMQGGVPATFKLSHANTGSRELSPPLNGRVRIVKLVTVDRMVDHAEERARIAKEHSAAAIDMETDVIAEACAGIAIPMISLRVISDSPVAPFPVPAEVLFDIKRQRTSFGRLIPYVLAHPSAIGRLSRFADQINRARTILTDAVLNVVTNIRSA
jgi:purine-nucleoside phosphorylase